MNQKHLEVFSQSLERVTSSTAFFDCFYEKFISQSDEINEFFKNRDMRQLKKKLRETLFLLTETAEGRPGLRLYVQMLGRIHKRLNVQRRHFTMWEEALLDAVRIHDVKFNDRVLAAWLYVIDDVIDTMFNIFDETHLIAS